MTQKNIMEINDNILENFMFDFVLRNKSIQTETLNFVDFIYFQNISLYDKKEIIYEIFWNGIVDEKKEINKVILDYRKWNKIPKIYEILFKIFEEELNLYDKYSLNFIQNESKFELENLLNILSFKIFMTIFYIIKKELLSKKSIFERFSWDFLNDEEKTDFINFIQKLNYNFDEEDKKTILKINEILKSFLEINDKIKNIK